MKLINLFLDILCFSLLIFIWGFVIITFKELPETIPVHFGANGKPDGFGAKTAIWSLPAIGSGTFALLFHLAKNPSSEMLNLPSNIKASRTATRFIVQLLNIVVLSMMMTIAHGSVLMALGEKDGINTTVMSGLTVLLFLIIIGLLIYSTHLSKIKKSLRP